MKLLEKDMYLWHILFIHLYFFQPLVNLRLVWLTLTGDKKKPILGANFRYVVSKLGPYVDLGHLKSLSAKKKWLLRPKTGIYRQI